MTKLRRGDLRRLIIEALSDEFFDSGPVSAQIQTDSGSMNVTLDKQMGQAVIRFGSSFTLSGLEYDDLMELSQLLRRAAELQEGKKSEDTLNEEEADFKRDYEAGLIDQDEYIDLSAKFNDDGSPVASTYDSSSLGSFEEQKELVKSLFRKYPGDYMLKQAWIDMSVHGRKLNPTQAAHVEDLAQNVDRFGVDL